MPDLNRLSLPSCPGVYRFYNQNDALLYVGKSINLAQRIRSHYQAGRHDPKEARLTGQTARIDWTLTAGEIGALLLESQQIKTLHPLFNRRLRKTRQLWTLHPMPVPGSEQVEIGIRALTTDEAQPKLFGLFPSKARALRQLKRLATEHQLCERLLGLERGQGRCFGHQIGRCHGACCGKESLHQHNQRLELALTSKQLAAWPFPSSLVLEEPSQINPTQSDWHLVSQWAYLGAVTQPEQLTRLEQRSVPGSFDLDAYFILQKALKQPGLNAYLWENQRLAAVPRHCYSTPAIKPKTGSTLQALS